MTSPDAASALPDDLFAALLARWREMELTAAYTEATAQPAAPRAIAAQLAAAALAHADQDAAAAQHWLDLADRLVTDEPTTPASLDYARARLLVAQGRLDAAEAALRRAQSRWQADGQSVDAARANLGLTQILAMQGRLDAAAAAAQAAVSALDDTVAAHPTAAAPVDVAPVDVAPMDVALLRVRAWRNVGVLQTMREQHRAALESFARARTAATELVPGPEIDAEIAHIRLNEAGAFTFLDAIDEAEHSLRLAMEAFARTGDRANRGRAGTNLGRLLVRSGRYAEALTHFDAAARDLLGDDLRLDDAPPADAPSADLRVADELLLEWSWGYLTLNLHPEAERTLNQAEALFRTAGQPYELGQTLYARGYLLRAQADVAAAQAAVDEARRLFESLGNPYWTNRTRLLLARLALDVADTDAALTLATLPLATETGATETGVTETGAGEATAWDLASRVEAGLIQVDAYLAHTDLAHTGAAAAAAALDALMAQIGAPESLPAVLARQVRHAQGRVARATGDMPTARRRFQEAVHLLEQQRASLPLEQLRTAYLLDKDPLFSDLVLSLLEQPAPSDDAIGAVFAVIEGMRSRVLLEQLLALTRTSGAGTPRTDSSEDAADTAQREELRRRLNWLYNQLLGEEGSRRRFVAMSTELQQTEARLARLELRRAPLLPEAAPVSLTHLQAHMPAARVLVIYYVADQEVLALVVTPDSTHLFRRLTDVSRLEDAIDEFHFQLGRMEVRGGNPARLHRIATEIRAALARFHALLVAPFAHMLHGRAVTWIPYGPLHQVPLHALWCDDGYLLESVESSYAPNATLALRGWQAHPLPSLRTLAAVAVDDPSIPAARAEAEAVAHEFPDATLYVAEAATLAGLRQAAAEADVLHIATHGLFRHDNPFFSALKLADAWIDVRELYRLPLAARLVVLSACESGAGRTGGGDELIGLARGFLAAGAQTLVVSRWNVHDTTGAQLMTRFHQLLRTEGATPASALRMAQLEAIRAGMHPYYWASFQVVS